MTTSPTSAERAALKVAQAATMTPDASYDLVSAVVFALGSAQLLQSPETAAELEKLREQVARLSKQADRVRTDELRAGDRVWHPYEMSCFTVGSVPVALNVDLRFHNRSSDTFESGLRVTGADDSGETVHVDAAQSYMWRREDVAAELERLRARVAELEQRERTLHDGIHRTATEAGQQWLAGYGRALDAVRAETRNVWTPTDLLVLLDWLAASAAEGQSGQAPDVDELDADVPVPFVPTERAADVLPPEVARPVAKLRALLHPLDPGVQS